MTPPLWVPQQLSSDVPPPSGRASFITITGGYEELFGKPPTWEELKALLGRYDLGTVLEFLGRLSAALGNVSLSGAPDFQQTICRGVMGARSEGIIRAAESLKERLGKDGYSGPIVLFHQLQAVNLAKVALLALPASGGPEESDLQWLGEAMLMIGDLAEPRLKDPTEGSDAHEQGLEQYVMANALFHQSPNLVHGIARAFELYMTDHVNLAGHPDYMNLPARITSATGLAPDVVWAATFALAGHWHLITPENVHERSALVARSTYFTQNLEISREESGQLFGLLLAEVEDLKEVIQVRYSLEDLRWFDVLPFSQHPLIGIGDHAFNPSAPLLLDKLVRGFHHIHLTPSFPKAERDAYLRFMGAVFEKYVDRILRRTYPEASGRYVTGETLRQLVPATLGAADGLVLYGGAAILIETKATLLDSESRAGADWDRYESKVSDIFLDALSQVFDTIAVLKDGGLAKLGLEGAVSTFYPVIVTLEPLVMWPLLYNRIAKRAQAAGLDQPEGTRPWQLVTIEELEFIEVGVGSGRSVVDLLDGKLRDERTTGESLTNFCFIEQEAWLTGGLNATLAARYEQLGERALTWARERARSKANEVAT